MATAKGHIAGAGDHNDARIRITICTKQRIQERLLHRSVYRVALLFILNLYYSDVTQRLDKNVTHLSLSS
jgi:hypothetical protein